MFRRLRIGWTLKKGRIKDGRPNNLNETKRGLTKALIAIRDRWARQVYGDDPLPGCRRIRNREYMESLAASNVIRFPDGAELSGAVVARYKYASNIEEGYPSFDIKRGLLRGPKAKTDSKGNRYNIVGFRWATPDSNASSGGHTNLMNTPLYERGASGLADERQQNTPRAELGEAQLQYIDDRTGSSWAVPKTSHTGYEHQRPMAAGMRKEGAARHHQYYSYRTVSKISDPASWINPGQPPNPIAAAVENVMRETAQRLVMQGFQKDIDTIFS